MADESETKPDFASGIAISAIPEGGIVAGRVGEAAVLLTRQGDDVRAFGDRCTHLGAPLADGLVVDGTLRCPWHHACFDLRSGKALAAPAFDPLPCWQVERDGSQVRVVGREPRPSASAHQSDPAGRAGIVLIGGGAAAYAAAFALREHGFDGPVTMVSSDSHEPYDRTLLTKDYLDGKFGDDCLPIATRTLSSLGVTFLGGQTVTTLDRAAKRVHLESGAAVPYTKLLLATGAEPRHLAVPGADLPHVHLLRSLDDCRAILNNITPDTRVAVIGSSFIGLEAAASLRSRGCAVTVLTPETQPMAKIVGTDLSRAMLNVHTSRGVVFYLKAKVTGITADAVHLANGAEVKADTVIVGIGVAPRTQLAEAAGLVVDGGVMVSSQLQTSDPDIFAAGDIAAWPDIHTGQRIRVEHWVVAERQGQTAALNMLGRSADYTDIPFFWSKHFDFSFRYVGHADGWNEVSIDGNLSERDAVIRYNKNGQLLAAATVGRDIEAIKLEIAMRKGKG